MLKRVLKVYQSKDPFFQGLALGGSFLLPVVPLAAFATAATVDVLGLAGKGIGKAGKAAGKATATAIQNSRLAAQEKQQQINSIIAIEKEEWRKAEHERTRPERERQAVLQAMETLRNELAAKLALIPLITSDPEEQEVIRKHLHLLFMERAQKLL